MSRRTRLILRRATRRAFVWLILPALILLTTRLIWGWQADYRLHLVEARLHAQGISTNLADYVDPKIPDDQNTVVSLTEACTAISKISREDLNVLEGADKLGSIPEITWTSAEIPTVDRIYADNPTIMTFIDAAATRPAVAWPPEFPLDFNNENPLSLSRLRELTNFCALAAIRAHDQHNDIEALHDLNRALTIPRAVDQSPTVISHLLAVACRAMIAATVNRLESELPWNDPQIAVEARQLMQNLAEQNHFHEALVRSLQGDPILSQPQVPRWIPIVQNWWLAPLQTQQLRRDLQDVLAVFPAYTATDWPSVKRLSPAPYSHLDLNINELVFLGNISIISLDRIILLSMRGQTDVRAASLLLAARIFAAEHGHLPANAEEIIPILGIAPIDPFTSPPTILKYRIDPLGPTIWTVGENGIDDGGTYASGSFRSSRWKGADEIYGAAWRAAAPPPVPTTSPSTAP